MSITINRTDEYVDYNVSAPNNRGYLTIDTSSWIDKPWMFYELPALKFEIYTETDGELVKYQNFSREIRTYNPVYSPLGVLNVTIDIRNVPEEFILRITPIFDNDAVVARNMLIENGIESGAIWGSDQDVPTQSFDLDIEFIECEGEYIPPVQPTHEETITGVPPITFDGSTGEPLVSWTILGNSSQSGTPTPDNPVMPEFVGVRTAQLFDKSVSSNVLAAYIDGSGKIISNAINTCIIIAVEPNTTYTVSASVKATNGCRIAEYQTKPAADSVGTVKATLNAGDDYKFTITTANSTNYIAFHKMTSGASDRPEFVKAVMVNEGSTALPYEPFGYKIPISCGGQTTPVYLGEVQTVRRVKKLVLTGQEQGWVAGQAGGGAIRFRLPISDITIQADTQRPTSKCTHFPLGVEGGTWNYDNVYTISYANDAWNLWLRVANINTLNNLQQYLRDEYAAGTPVTIWYVLATPETGITNEPLAKIGTYADELSSEDAGVSIPTVKGQNVLTVDTPIQPSEMTITYIKEGQ